MKKIAIILGRGIEGCGVTKFTLELCKYYAKHEYDYKVYASKDKTWTRKDSHNTDNIHQLMFEKDEEVDYVIKELNKFDVVIVNSLPARSAKDEVIENFKRLLVEITAPVVLIQHDHSMRSIRRNGAMDEALEKADVIFSHSIENDFTKFAEEKVGTKITVFGEERGTPILPFQPGMYFDEVKEKYWKDTGHDMKHHKWIGRTVAWKGYEEMLKYHSLCLKQNDMLTTFEGIERSPTFLHFQGRDAKEPEYHVFENLLRTDPEEYDMTNSYGELPLVFGPFVQEDMLERLSKVGFGYQLSRMPPKFIERSIEYTHCEVVCTGTIPVFNKVYGDSCTHRHYGKKLIDCESNGTIWFDKNNLEETLDQTLEVINNPAKRKKMRDDAFEFYKLHQDADHTFKELMENILRYLT